MTGLPRGAFLGSCLVLVLRTLAPASELPQWEAGLGAGVLSMPDYRGSDRNRTYLFPVPYLIYRGDALKVDRGSVRGVFFRSGRLELDTSFNGAPPVRSGGNGARKGMPDLDPALEAGPSLKYLMHRGPDGRFRVELQFPLRMVLATDLSYVRSGGIVFHPRISAAWSRVRESRRWNAGAALGPVFIDTRNSRRFYQVDPLYATAERPAYDAHGGYAGMQLALAATGRLGSVWIGAFSRIDSLHGARFEDSPLVRARWNVTAGIACSWVLGSSGVLVEADE